MILRTLSDRTTVTQRQQRVPGSITTAQRRPLALNCGCRQTFIFSYVLEGECEARVFPLDDSHLSECAFANHSQKTKVVEVDWERCQQSVGLDMQWS